MPRRPLHSWEDSRYETIAKIARGGMATVYVGRLRGAAGFSRLVAIKRAHAHVADDPKLSALIVEEARIASRLFHPNVVPVLDVEQVDDELLLVMEYVEGASFAHLIQAASEAGRPLDPAITIRIGLDVCAGLRAAHDLRDEDGDPAGLIHRDISPQNVLVGTDGVARLTDFGIAKSHDGELSATTSGSLKGKIAYMAPEYVQGEVIGPQADLFALGIVIWEALAHERLFHTGNVAQTLHEIVNRRAPSLVDRGVPRAIDEVVQRALTKRPEERFEDAKAMAAALERAARPHGLVADSDQVAARVEELFGRQLTERRRLIRQHDRRSQTELDDDDLPTLPGPVTEPMVSGEGLTEVIDAAATTLGGSDVSLPPPTPPSGRRGRWPLWALSGVALAGMTLAVLALQGDEGDVGQAGEATATAWPVVSASSDVEPPSQEDVVTTSPEESAGDGGGAALDPAPAPSSEPEVASTSDPSPSALSAEPAAAAAPRPEPSPDRPTDAGASPPPAPKPAPPPAPKPTPPKPAPPPVAAPPGPRPPQFRPNPYE